MAAKEAHLLLVVTKSLQHNVLQAMYDDPTFGHMAFAKTYHCNLRRFQ